MLIKLDCLTRKMNDIISFFVNIILYLSNSFISLNLYDLLLKIQMKNQLLLFGVYLLTYVICFTNKSDCSPYGTRLALGKSYHEPSSPQDLSVRFNTKIACPDSYMQLFYQENTIHIPCVQKEVSYEKYKTYIHLCSIEKIQEQVQFQYMVYGWSEQSKQDPIPDHNISFTTHLPSKNPTNQLNMIVLADWAYIQNPQSKYDKLDQSMDYLLSLKSKDKYQEIDVLYINGDIAYDLDSSNGIKYQNFLIMLSQVSVYWPVIITTGNHQRKSNNSLYIFENSFQLYGLIQNNFSSLDLGIFILVRFDPYSIVLEGQKDKQLYQQFQNTLKAASLKRKPIIVASHYPLFCSGTSQLCVKDRHLLKKFFAAMIDYHVLFYIGAHHHVYQRMYPYNGDTFIRQQSPYNFTADKRYLITVVQGIAGNQKGIVQEQKVVSEFTNAIQYNQTGYGKIKIDKKSLIYEHYSSKQPKVSYDSMIINYSSQGKLYLRSQE